MASKFARKSLAAFRQRLTRSFLKKSPLLDQPALELPQVGRRDLGRSHRLAVGAHEPGSEGVEVRSIVLDVQGLCSDWARKPARRSIGSEPRAIVICRVFRSIGGRTGDLCVEVAGRSTYNAGPTPCGGLIPVESILNKTTPVSAGRSAEFGRQAARTRRAISRPASLLGGTASEKL